MCEKNAPEGCKVCWAEKALNCSAALSCSQDPRGSSKWRSDTRNNQLLLPSRVTSIISKQRRTRERGKNGNFLLNPHLLLPQFSYLKANLPVLFNLDVYRWLVKLPAISRLCLLRSGNMGMPHHAQFKTTFK